MSDIRKSYTDEFKREAVRLAKERGNITATARDLGISDTSLVNWKKQLELTPQNPFPGNGNPHDKETAQLQRELGRLKEENEILKKLWVSSLPAPIEIPVHFRATGVLLPRCALQGNAGLSRRLLRLEQTSQELTTTTE